MKNTVPRAVSLLLLVTFLFQGVGAMADSGGSDAIDFTSHSDGQQVDAGQETFSGEVERAGAASGQSLSLATDGPDAVLRALEADGGPKKAILSLDPEEVVDLTPEDGEMAAARAGPPVPSDSDGIGPGTPLLVYANGEVGLCTANYVWEDQDATVYIGAAGHCFFRGSDDSKVATHGPGADMPDTGHISVLACVQMCAYGGASRLVDGATGNLVAGFTGDLRTLGGVAYARQGPQTYGEDFGLVRIPASLHDLVRAEMPVWNGPTGPWTPPASTDASASNPSFTYGNSVGLGETMATKARAGTYTILSGNYPGTWISDLPAAQGDSGAAVNFGARTDTSEVVQADAAMGILTHLYGHPLTAGTTIEKAVTMATEAGLAIDFLREGEVPRGGPVDRPPVADAQVSSTTVEEGGAVTLDGTGSTDDGTITAYHWTEAAGSDCGGTITDPDSAMASWTAPAGSGGKDCTFVLTVTDDADPAQQDTDAVTVSVNGPVPKEHVEIWVEGVLVQDDIAITATDTWTSDPVDLSDYDGRSITVEAQWHEADDSLVASHAITLQVGISDADGDGIPDGSDNCPSTPNADQGDIDGDGIGDACDPRDNRDTDGDGVENWRDSCEGHDDFIDQDHDGIPDGCDLDRDGDGVDDGADAFPDDPAEWADSDGDGVGDNSDACAGSDDNADMDGDGIPDGCDDDRDGDGFSNTQESNAGYDPDDASSHPGSGPPQGVGGASGEHRP